MKQYQALLGTEGVALEFRPEAIRRIAELAFQVNERTENIGARRLYTVLEKLLEEVSFEAGKRGAGTVTIDAAYVDARLADLARNEDLARFVLKLFFEALAAQARAPGDGQERRRLAHQHSGSFLPQ